MKLAICGLIVLLISCALTLQDYFLYIVNGHQPLIREGKNQLEYCLEYWGMDFLSFMIAIFFFVYAISASLKRNV